MSNASFQGDASGEGPSLAARLGELAALFLRLGATAFGGPAAHIAMLEDEVVRRRRWLSGAEFLDLLSVTNLIPGPNSTEMAIHIGYRRAGWPGLLCAGACFILPAFCIVLAIAWLYVRYGNLPAAESLLYGVKPVVMAIVAHALWRLGRTAIRSGVLLAICAASVTALLLGVHELVTLFGAAALTAAIESGIARRGGSTPSGGAMALAPIPDGSVIGPVGAAGAAAGAATAVSLWPLFWIFLKIGSVLFGSGYVLLAFLRADFVERLGWLSEGQLLDAVAMGQVTPGPVFTTATFIGFVLAGPAGALVATVGIFLPAFVFVGLSAPFVPRLRRSVLAGRFLNGLNVASLAMMGVVSVQLARAAMVDWVAVVVALVSLALLVRWRVNSAWLVLGGGAVGLLVG